MTAIASSPSAFLLAAAKWAVEKDMFLDDFVKRFSLPHLALVTKGQYLSIGAPNVANPGLKPYVLVHSRQTINKVLAQLVRIKDGKRKVITENKVAIPESYRGYFEILSEGGRPVKCIESVYELCQKFPELCLVRQSCKAYLPDADGELRSLYRTRTVTEGEVLTLVGQFNFKRVVFLRCFDELGASVYLKLGQKAKFSPIAAQEHITGVHSIDNLINKRLPLTVRLVQGRCPTEFQKLTGGGPLVLQLNSVYQEDLVFIYSLQRDEGQVLAVPLKAHIKLAPGLNQQQIRKCDEFDDVVDRCQMVLSDATDKMALVNDHELVYRPLSPDTTPLDSENGQPPQETPTRVCDEEIDQLYDYIRGLAPIPNKTQTPGANKGHGRYKKASATPKPPAPPVETMPARRSGDSGKIGHRHVIRIEEISSSPDESSVQKENSTFGIVTEPNGSKHSRSPETTSPGSTAKSAPKSHRSSQERVSGLLSHERQKRLSKSTEKISPFGYAPPFPMPMPFPPPILMNNNHIYRRPGTAEEPSRHRPAASSKRRPLSMVIPDNVPLPLRPPYPPMMPRNPHFTQGLLANYQSRMYQSAANLNSTPEEKADNNNDIEFTGSTFIPNAGMSPAYGAPYGPPMRTPIYPRYSPGYYQAQALYR